jgi:hypothetical protein
MSMTPPTASEIRTLAAENAVEILGGCALAAEKISAMTGQLVTRHRMKYWQQTGIQPRFCPAVHQLTRIPLSQLDPEIYPVYLFAS